MQTVRVRHNGEVIPIVALTIDESLCGGDEIYRFVLCFALPFELESNLKITLK